MIEHVPEPGSLFSVFFSKLISSDVDVHLKVFFLLVISTNYPPPSSCEGHWLNKQWCNTNILMMTFKCILFIPFLIELIITHIEMGLESWEHLILSSIEGIYIEEMDF